MLLHRVADSTVNSGNFPVVGRQRVSVALSRAQRESRSKELKLAGQRVKNLHSNAKFEQHRLKQVLGLSIQESVKVTRDQVPCGAMGLITNYWLLVSATRRTGHWRSLRRLVVYP